MTPETAVGTELEPLDGTVVAFDRSPVSTDPVLEQLRDRLRSLDAYCLTGLQEGLAAMLAGDHTYEVQRGTEPISASSADPHIRALVDIFNSMLQRSQEALGAYEQLREELAAALGDHSCLSELRERLHSLEEHCLTDLDQGLQAVVDGDLTRLARPVTLPLRPRPDSRLGDLGETFNLMLARSRTALRSYDTMREDLRVALGDQSCMDELRAKLHSLNRHCLRDLDEGLDAVASGTTLTRAVQPVTKPVLPAHEDADIGELAEVFNRMLKRTQSTLSHYDQLRQQAAGGSFGFPPMAKG